MGSVGGGGAGGRCDVGVGGAIGSCVGLCSTAEAGGGWGGTATGRNPRRWSWILAWTTPVLFITLDFESISLYEGGTNPLLHTIMKGIGIFEYFGSEELLVDCFHE